MAETVTDTDEVTELDAMELEPWADAVPRLAWVRIRADEISGRRIPVRDGW